MFSRRMFRPALVAALLACGAGGEARAEAASPPRPVAPEARQAGAQPTSATAAPPAPLFRVILQDGTALVPYFERLPAELHEPFRERYREKLRAVWPEHPLFFTFRRILLAASRPAAPEQ